MDLQYSIRKAHQVLSIYFGQVGTAVHPSPAVVQRKLEEFDLGQRDDSFYMYFDVKAAQVKRVGRNVRDVLGINELNYEVWLKLIHPDFIKIYLEFGLAAYQASFKYRDELIRNVSSYSINLPVLRTVADDQKEYWLIKQTSYPFEFDQNNNMVTHVNTYTLLGRFDKYAPMRPFVFFDAQSNNQIEQEILRKTQENVFNFFFPHLGDRHKKVLLEFWMTFSKHKIEGSAVPNSVDIANVLGKKQQTILDYNKSILEAAREAFPITDFPNIQGLITFLYDLFGPIEGRQ